MPAYQGAIELPNSLAQTIKQELVGVSLWDIQILSSVSMTMLSSVRLAPKIPVIIMNIQVDHESTTTFELSPKENK
jgi:hypothetical protein|tara:strand:+ start:327 stop:554 length:228 start_codon:yes stop_codon:yes gene_type:complete